MPDGVVATRKREIIHDMQRTVAHYPYVKCKFMESARRGAKMKVRTKREKRVKEEKEKKRGTQREVRRKRKESKEDEKGN